MAPRTQADRLAEQLYSDVESIQRAFPKWRFESDLTDDGLPSLMAWLPWQYQDAATFAIAFAHTRYGWTAATPEGRRFGRPRAYLPLVVHDHLAELGRFGVRPPHPITGR